eukprot:Amastigsp_a844281_11.p2 type:complete len:217 gc:universal Amastigsp_a844281_11:740-90(-)
MPSAAFPSLRHPRHRELPQRRPRKARPSRRLPNRCPGEARRNQRHGRHVAAPLCGVLLRPELRRLAEHLQRVPLGHRGHTPQLRHRVLCGHVVRARDSTPPRCRRLGAHHRISRRFGGKLQALRRAQAHQSTAEHGRMRCKRRRRRRRVRVHNDLLRRARRPARQDAARSVPRALCCHAHRSQARVQRGGAAPRASPAQESSKGDEENRQAHRRDR